MHAQDLTKMEIKDDKHSEYTKVLNSIHILRKTTRFVKVVPFVYALLFLLCMCFYFDCSENILDIIDECFYVSPIVCLTFVRLSYLLKFCNWYRLQCCLPMLPLPIVIIDENFYEFGEASMWVNFFLTFAIFFLSLVNAYFVFIRPKKKHLANER